MYLYTYQGETKWRTTSGLEIQVEKAHYTPGSVAGLVPLANGKTPSLSKMKRKVISATVAPTGQKAV